MFSRMILSVAFISALILAPEAYAGRVELTTYYPAPFGEYQTLQATGSNTNNSDIAFQAGGSDAATRVFITNANQMGIGKRPDSGVALDVNGFIQSSSDITGSNITASRRLGSTDTGEEAVYAPNGTIRGKAIATLGGSAARGGFYAKEDTAYAASFLYHSDSRLKENIVPVPHALEKIGRLTGVNFTFKSEPGEKHLGLIAQEVEAVVPEVVRMGPDGMKSVDYASLVALLIQGMKEQQQEISALREKLGRVQTADIPGR